MSVEGLGFNVAISPIFGDLSFLLKKLLYIWTLDFIAETEKIT